MGYVLSPLFNGVSVIDANGDPLAGGKLYTYASDTTTPKLTYQDGNGYTAHANPIILDSRGTSQYPIWLLDGASDVYGFAIKTADDVPVGIQIDNIRGVSPGTIQQFPPTANVDMGGYRITNLAAASSTNDALSRYYADTRYALNTLLYNIDANNKRITNLPIAASNSEAMSRAACDERYVPTTRTITTLTANASLVAANNGQIIMVDSAGAVTITLADANTAGWNCSIIRKGAGAVTIQRETTGTINGATSSVSIAAQWGRAEVVNYATGAASIVRVAA